jgi:hypothetical protein
MYRGLLETFLNAEADNEEEAYKLMIEELIDELRNGSAGLIIWEERDDNR